MARLRGGLYISSAEEFGSVEKTSLTMPKGGLVKNASRMIGSHIADFRGSTLTLRALKDRTVQDEIAIGRDRLRLALRDMEDAPRWKDSANLLITSATALGGGTQSILVDHDVGAALFFAMAGLFLIWSGLTGWKKFRNKTSVETILSTLMDEDAPIIHVYKEEQQQ